MNEKIKQLQQDRAQKIDAARALITAAEAEKRDLTGDEQTQWDGFVAEADALEAKIKREERQAALDATLEKRTEVRTAQPSDDLTADGDRPAKTPAEVRAGKDRAREARMAQNTLKMLNGITTRQYEAVRIAQRDLAREGFYGPEGEKRAAGDYYSTLVDGDGAYLLPTVVADGIERIGNIYGVARQLCQIYNHTVGTLKVPASSGALTANAVAEGGVITSAMRAFTAVTLNPKKWALIVPWTYEVNLEVGPQVLEDVQFGIGLGFAQAEDDALFNGDGTATYNSIDGILSSNRTIGSYVMAATNTSFDDLSTDDVFFARRKIPAATRMMGTYAFHPDMEPVLRTLKDGDGRYIYAFNSDTGVSTLGGRPVVFTEVLPDIAADAVSTVFGVFGAFRYFKMAIGQGLSSEELREGTVEDADTGTDINLATQDMRALKVRELFDMDTNFESAFCGITTAAA